MNKLLEIYGSKNKSLSNKKTINENQLNNNKNDNYKSPLNYKKNNKKITNIKSKNYIAEKIIDDDIFSSQISHANSEKRLLSQKQEVPLEPPAFSETNLSIGIFDQEGKNPNPLTGEKYSDEYKTILKKITKLPAYKNLHDILKLIQNNDVIILTSSTGSGKSLFVPKVALHSTNYKGVVMMTLPKQTIARSAAEFGAKTMDVPIETGIVGYKYRDNTLYNDKTKILYMTDGSLINMVSNDITLNGIDIVIMDELHERNTRIDILLYFFKNTLQKRKDFKLILMSATMDTTLFKNYYSNYKVGVLNLEGDRLYSIKSIYLDKEEKDYMKKGFEMLKNIVKDTKNGDIMFFVPSTAETTQICNFVRADKLFSSCYCMELSANVSEKQKAFIQDTEAYKTINKPKIYVRKIIICTNIAESSLTIDGIQFVIESGYEYKENYDPIFDVRCLDKNRITQSQSVQRCGRSGRTTTGTCYCLYTNDEYRKMEKYPKPAIQLVNLVDMMLKFIDNDKKNGIKIAMEQFLLFIEPPKEIFIRSAYLQLLSLNLISEKPEPHITDIGRIVKLLQIDDPKIGICVAFAYQYNCVREITFLFDYIEALKGNVLNIFSNVKENENEELIVDNKIKKQTYDHFFIKNSDHLSLLNIILTYMNQEKDKKNIWCKKFNLNSRLLENASQRSKRNLGKRIHILSKLKIKSIDLPELSNNEKILFAVYSGYYVNILNLNNGIYSISNKYGSSDKKEIIGTIKNTFLNTKELPKTIICHEIFKSIGGYEYNIISELTSNIKKLLGKQ